MKCFLLLAGVLGFTSSLRGAAPDTMSLAGNWRFALDRQAQQTQINSPRPLPPGAGIEQEWFGRDLAEHIELPGILQAQGYGDEISPETPWVLTLGDAWWKLQPAALRDHFSKPGAVEIPFLSQPPKHYLGAAWFQRDVDIPDAWRGKRITLFLERPHWETRVWLDRTECGRENSLVVPHVHDLGTTAPGQHRLTVRVDNRRLLVEPNNDEHSLDSHSVSDALGASWNGIVGRIELVATSRVWIEDAQVFPDLAAGSAKVKIQIGNSTGRPGKGQIFAGKVELTVEWTAAGGHAEVTIPLPADAQTWDEFHPNLQQLIVKLTGDDADDEKSLTYGIRQISWQDKELLLNGRAINLRTTHFGGDFPRTGYPATDLASWKRIYGVCREYGLNGMRFHSWCPPEAAFLAADEMGFYLQPESGLWSPFNRGGVYTQMLMDESARLLKAYGNHPSFILLSPGNEPGGHYVEITPGWAAENYRRDPRRLYSAGTGWSRPAQVQGGVQYASLVRFPGGELRNTTGWFGRDYRSALTNIHVPVLAHEVGQWCAYPNFDVISKFTGYLRPSNYHIFRYIAEQAGLLDRNAELARASGRFQLACYKEEIEANLRTPGLAGYQLLDLHDYLGQGTALIGVLDAFWESKGYVTPEEFRRFNGTTVPLARLEKRTFTTAETLVAETEIYHYGEMPLAHVVPYWKIVASDGAVAVQGKWSPREIPIGKNIVLGKISAELAALAAPGAYRLVVGLEDQPVENDWNFWLYPPRHVDATPSDMLETSDWREAEKVLARGGKVLLTPDADALDAARCPPMKQVPVFWNIQMTVRPPRNPTARFDAFLGLLCDPEHPSLALFPTASNCDWQWTPLVNNVGAINLSQITPDLRPIVSAVDDWNRDWRLGVIFECTVGTGRLLVSAIPLSGDSGSPVARQLRHSLLEYMASEKFRPPTAIPPADFVALWRRDGAAEPTTPPRNFDPDLNDGSTTKPHP